MDIRKRIMRVNDFKHGAKEQTLIKTNKKINLTIKNKEVYALQGKFMSPQTQRKVQGQPQPQPQNQPEETTASLFNVIKNSSLLHYRRNRMITSCSPIKKGDCKEANDFMIYNPKVEKRNYSSTKEEIINRCHHTLDDEDAKVGTIILSKASLHLKKKVKDARYYAMVIQEYWRHYCKMKQYKKTKLHKETRRLYHTLFFLQRKVAYDMKKLLIRRLKNLKPVQYEVTAKDYYLIQLLKEFNITTVDQLHQIMNKTLQKTRTRQGIIKNNNSNKKKLFE